MKARARSISAACIAAVAAQAVLAGCAAEDAAEADVGYGATGAGPTTGPTTGPTAPEPAARTEPSHDGATRRPGPVTDRRRMPCALFTTAEVASRLGLDVARGVLTKRGAERICTWDATEEPRVPSWRIGDPVLDHDDGVVTVATAPASAYQAIRARTERTSRARGGSALHELDQFGPGAVAMGASVSGVPLWFALARHDGRVVVVEVSGADSRSSVATVIEFLGETLARL